MMRKVGLAAMRDCEQRRRAAEGQKMKGKFHKTFFSEFEFRTEFPKN